MRLPQARIRPLSVHCIHFSLISALLLFFGVASVSAGPAVPQLACSPSSLRFGRVNVGQTETLVCTLKNSGPTSVTVSAIAASDPEFSASKVSLPLILPAGQSADVNVNFAPTAKGQISGTVSLVSNASNGTLVVNVTGSGMGGGSLTASPSSLSFGQVAVGSNTSLRLMLTNSQSKKMYISAVQTTTNLFSITGPAFPMTLSGGASVTLTITFTPKSSGLVGDSVFVSGPSVSIALTGTGTTAAVGQLGIAPSALNYGDVSVGTTGTLPLSLSAAGASVTITSASSSSSQFVLEGTSLPLTIAPGQSKSVSVGFTPKSSGTVSGLLSFASNASNSQATESLTGIGTVTPSSVSLFWNASSNVVGYNIYRGTSSNGPYSKINPKLDANTAYVDNTVVSGSTYYYAATSVNSSGMESNFSSPAVQAVVP